MNKSPLDDIQAALQAGDPHGFMAAVEVLGEIVASGAMTWTEAADWARSHADYLVAARSAFGAWSLELGDLLYDPTRGWEEAERAAIRRSQLGHARELFAGTSASEVLDELASKEFDHDLREQAERIDVFRPQGVPASHIWWKPPSGG